MLVDQLRDALVDLVPLLVRADGAEIRGGNFHAEIELASATLRIADAGHVAPIRFGAGERGAKFLCKLDKKKYKPCTSPKTYTGLLAPFAPPGTPG